MQVTFSKIELEISPFLTEIQFYSNIVEKRVGKSPQDFQRGQHSEIYLLTLKGQDKTKMELSLEIVSISASICWTTTTLRIVCTLQCLRRDSQLFLSLNCNCIITQLLNSAFA